MTSKFKFMALGAIAAIGCAAGIISANSANGSNQSALSLINVEALSKEEQNDFCKWERLLDPCGCIYHKCTSEGEGYICRCGDELLH